MPAKKKTSEVRATHLGIRLTTKERKRLREVARRFGAIPESAVARLALHAGLDVLERDGIPAAAQD